MGSITENKYSIILSPIITEKTAYSNSQVFKVHPKANKVQIKEAVEKIFDVKVESVRTINYMGKVKRVGAKTGKQAAWKKAYVELKPGSEINIVDGI